jgi:hypothetical protein
MDVGDRGGRGGFGGGRGGFGGGRGGRGGYQDQGPPAGRLFPWVHVQEATHRLIEFFFL